MGKKTNENIFVFLPQPQKRGQIKKIQNYFCSFFGANENFKSCFQDLLTFRGSSCPKLLEYHQVQIMNSICTLSNHQCAINWLSVCYQSLVCWSLGGCQLVVFRFSGSVVVSGWVAARQAMACTNASKGKAKYKWGATFHGSYE